MIDAASFRQEIPRFLHYNGTVLGVLSTHTVRTYDCHLRHLATWLDATGQALTVGAIQDYQTFLHTQGKKRSSINAAICGALGSFCGWYCARTGQPNPIESVPKFTRKVIQDETERRVLTAQEVESLRAIARGIDLDTLETFANSGLRAAEFLSLTVASVQNEWSHLHIIGKGRKPRDVPINTLLRSVLERNIDGQNFRHVQCWWAGVHTEHSAYSRIYTRLGQLAERARIQRFSCHALRHYFGTVCIVAGVPLAIVSQILGHESVEFTRKIYVHLENHDTEGSTECLVNVRADR